jgi:hypothetical protein
LKNVNRKTALTIDQKQHETREAGQCCSSRGEGSDEGNLDRDEDKGKHRDGRSNPRIATEITALVVIARRVLTIMIRAIVTIALTTTGMGMANTNQ